jgi:PncC family amidohydrolase
MNIFQRARRVGSLLKDIGYTLSICESCTGGMLSSSITSVPGSSEYFLGGVIAYANEVKIHMAGVRATTLKQHGAVSKAAAREMARGVRTRFKSHVSLSITGIAGPSGGARKKPVGRVYVGVAVGTATVIKTHTFSGTRKIIRRKACLAALQLLETTLRCLKRNTSVKQ